MKPIKEFEVVDHGIEHSQYFQGCGLAFTEYKDVSTGIGGTFADAVDDALDGLACGDWETEGMGSQHLGAGVPRQSQASGKTLYNFSAS